ncbi:MAG TPA: phosphatidylinositol mannoside acyltransferase [Acidimicrobiia bacterium]|nr:phosphatidylinositol mannoside acyltransferase [Acidimicrobiia bacterium]
MKDRLLYLLVRGAVGLFGLLPARWARAIGEWGGQIWFLVDGSRRRMVRRHMTRVLGEDSNPEHAVREVFRSYGRYWAETFWVRPSRIPALDRNLVVEGIEHLAAAARNGKGAVIALPHLGNWEAAALAGPRAGIKIVAVAERLANPLLTEWFTSLRASFGIEIHLNMKGVMRSVEQSVRAGAAVALLADRDLKGRGVRTEFFGEVTTLPAGPVALASRTGAPLLTAVCYFTPEGHHVVLGSPLAIPDVPNRLEVGTRAFAERMESDILKAPEQWHLLQPNWPSDREDNVPAITT